MKMLMCCVMVVSLRGSRDLLIPSSTSFKRYHYVFSFSFRQASPFDGYHTTLACCTDEDWYFLDMLGCVQEGKKVQVLMLGGR
jgi:hypothetical protein